MRGLTALLVLQLGLALPAVAADTPPVPPACGDAAHAQFDFWVGTWDVMRPDGTLAGTNRIEKILDGCVVFENWKSAISGYEGKSFNTFDPLSGKWNQLWVDTTGATLHFSGERRGDVMEMEGTQQTAEGPLQHRMSYTVNADGTIRQLWQQSPDGKDWQTLFDGLYRRKE
ncbi:MAG TPA: hypothetical protein VIC61_10735 [Gammaproteobacteria bacterium]|jgi:hypothetical protein